MQQGSGVEARAPTLRELGLQQNSLLVIKTAERAALFTLLFQVGEWAVE
jgi:hypothetical protein